MIAETASVGCSVAGMPRSELCQQIGSGIFFGGEDVFALR